MTGHSKVEIKRKAVIWLLNYALYIVLFLIIAVSAWISPNFFTVRNLYSMLLNNGHYLIIACGISLVLLTGLTDLSVGSIAYLSMVFSGIAMKNTQIGTVGGIAVCILTGIAAGTINGFFMVKMKLSPLLVTLGMQLVLRGIAMLITKSMYIYMPDNVYSFMTKTIGGFPGVMLLVILLVAILHMVLSLTGFGKNVYAVGCNPKAAKSLGINAEAVKFTCVILCCIFASLAGFYCASNLGTIQQTIGMSWEFDAIAISVLGGISLFGGYGKIFPGVCIGFLIISIIENILGLMGVSTYLIPIVNGIVIFASMFMDSLKYQYSNHTR
ncbi:MAG: ABC transporter permease [Lachnoclostridium edouardi]|uniref:ABC transporter permease n=1 Tax=Lachnoclostridium edouardi TaxID=1926283 RepID=UPI0026DD65BA|nr:ABC transporter permease [Lachnoclostridium edouardi]MDO4279728.1 ABC transporter permease [Lachnoclostridium edouardi]